MRRIRPPILAVVFLAMLSACQTPIFPGQDKVVVTGERELANAVDTVKMFWEFDHENLEFMKTKVPQVHAIAQETRRDFWVKFYDPTLAALRAYKHSKLPSDQQNAEDKLAALRSLVSRVRQALLQAQTAKAAPS